MDNMYNNLETKTFLTSPDGDPLSFIKEDPEPTDYHKKQVNVYCSACSKLNIIPVSYIQKRLSDTKIRIRGRGLGQKGIRAIAVALVRNHSVELLDVSDNTIGNVGVKALAQMLEENSTITDLILSENKIGSEGLQALCDVIARHDILKHLDLSGIGCQNKQVIHIKNMLDQNLHLRELRLSHNEISDEGCILLKSAISDNDTLEVLDLSWNHIRGQGARAIATGLMVRKQCMFLNMIILIDRLHTNVKSKFLLESTFKENRGLKSLDLSMNGFALEGCQAICQALIKNKTLLELNVSCNRIHSVALTALLYGLKKNITLTTLTLKGNPLTPQATVILLRALSDLKQCNLREVDLSDIAINEEFLEVLSDVQNQHPSMKIKHGPLLTYSNDGKENLDENEISSMDPRELLLNLIDRDGLRIIDLFQQLDTDKSLAISKEEFKMGLMNANVTVTETQLDGLLKLMDTDKNNEIDLGEMINAQREYKRDKLSVSEM